MFAISEIRTRKDYNLSCTFGGRSVPRGGSTAEVDYLVVVDGTIVPVELKSGASGRLRSMHLLLNEHPEIPRGIVFSSRMYSELPEQRLQFIPLYHAYSATGGSGTI